jgi:hypothetical protein
MLMFKEKGVSQEYTTEYFAEDVPMLSSRELDLTK